MAHLHRFYLPEAAAVSGEAALPPELVLYELGALGPRCRPCVEGRM